MTKEELLEFSSKEFAGIKEVGRRLSALACPDKKDAPEKKELGVNEAAAMGAFLFAGYSGIERVLEKVLVYDALSVSDTESKHTEILKKAFELGIMPSDLYTALSRYLAFRDYFSRSYVSDLNPEKLAALARAFEGTAGELEREILDYLESV